MILKNLLSREEMEEIRAAVQPLLEDETGRNNFEGYKTRRVYAVLAKTRALDKMIAHPVIMALLHEPRGSVDLSRQNVLAFVFVMIGFVQYT